MESAVLRACLLSACLSAALSGPADISRGVDWLTRYGYLPPPDPFSAQQQTADTLREAVRTMQRFAGLPDTGDLDDRTVEMMRTPRCALPDVMVGAGPRRRRRRRYVVSGAVWQKTHLTWRVHSFPLALDGRTLRDLVRNALETWSRETWLGFSETAGEADIRVAFLGGAHGDGYPFDGPGGTLGHAFFPGVGPMAGETHMDADESWTYNNRYFWRMQATRHLVSLHPAHLHHFWHGLPRDLPRLDAVYERQNDSKIVFIAGNRFWVFSDTQVEAGFPRPLSDYGLEVDSVDGAFVWKHNRKTYFFRGDRFWRYDDRLGRLDDGPQPKNIRSWHGLPSGIDDVISWVDGHTYFFRGAQYWQFRDGNVDAEPGYPRSIARDWMYCKDESPPPPSEEPAGRDQRGCNCPCPTPTNMAARGTPAWDFSMTAALSLLLRTIM